MVRKRTVCIILLITLFSLITLMQVYTDKFLANIETKIKKIEVSILDNKQNISNIETKNYVIDLEQYWNKEMPYICLMINYNDISPIGEAISRLVASIEANDFTSSNIETKQIIRITGALKKIFNIRISNLL